MSLSPEAFILPILVLVFEWVMVVYSGMCCSIVLELMSSSRTAGIGTGYYVFGFLILFSYLGLTILLTNGVRRGSVSALNGWVVTWSILWCIMIGFIIYFISLGYTGKYGLMMVAFVRLGAIIVINKHKNEVASAGQTLPQVHVIGKDGFHRV